jgi:hypothetical protein
MNHLVGVAGFFLGTAGLLAEAAGVEGVADGNIWIYYRRDKKRLLL